MWLRLWDPPNRKTQVIIHRFDVAGRTNLSGKRAGDETLRKDILSLSGGNSLFYFGCDLAD